MPKTRLRFTVRRLMLVIAIAASVLAAYIQAQNWRRRQALIDQLHTDIRVIDLAEAQAGAMAEATRHRHGPSKDVQDYEHGQVLLKQKGQELRARLSRLQR